VAVILTRSKTNPSSAYYIPIALQPKRDYRMNVALYHVHKSISVQPSDIPKDLPTRTGVTMALAFC